MQLEVESPGDMELLHDPSVEVRGKVSPAGTAVSVGGRRVAVDGGRFSATVSLAPGTNVVDVLAGRRGSRAAMVALRVRRQVDVRVPDLTGVTPPEAEDALDALGLESEFSDVGGIIDFLLPDDARVCETDPSAGTRVPPGTTVSVQIARSC